METYLISSVKALHFNWPSPIYVFKSVCVWIKPGREGLRKSLGGGGLCRPMSRHNTMAAYTGLMDLLRAWFSSSHSKTPQSHPSSTWWPEAVDAQHLITINERHLTQSRGNDTIIALRLCPCLLTSISFLYTQKHCISSFLFSPKVNLIKLYDVWKKKITLSTVTMRSPWMKSKALAGWKFSAFEVLSRPVGDQWSWEPQGQKACSPGD